jgi:dihydrofolate reductase
MREIVANLGMSVDGYIARSNGAVDFLFLPKDYSMDSFFETIDTAIMGRKTFDAALRMAGGAFTGSPLKTFVFSRSQPSGERDGATYTNNSPAAFMRRIRKDRGKNIWLMGGGELVREFLKADLLDELLLGIVPVLLGKGIPLFPNGFPERSLSLVESKTYSKGLIALRYRRIRTKGKR